MTRGDRSAFATLRHHDAHIPSPGAGLYHDHEPSRSRASAVFLEEVPHLIQLHDDRLPARSRLCTVYGRIPADPFQDGAGPHAKHVPQRVHGHAVAVEEYGE